MAIDDELENVNQETKAVLREWSAQDFSSIYSRFRPHLERHAWKFLRNQSQVDEVVQDAFLYLMVTLPELDSEIGVLRFLKWKTRLLCLDVIRANGRVEISSIDSHPEFESSDHDISIDLERADDAAVVRLALSKLNPRHREVLIAAMYEEKSSAQIAAQVGLSENATNQLIFRARASFKKALLGDGVDTSGMSVSRILSVATRKAANEAKKFGAQAMVLVLFLALSLGAFMKFDSESPKVQNEAASEIKPNSQKIPTVNSQAPAPNDGKTMPAFSVKKPTEIDRSNTPKNMTDTKVPWEPWEIEDIFISNGSEISFFSRAQVPQDLGVKQSYTVASSQGVAADFDFDSDAANPFSNLSLAISITGQQYSVIPTQTDFLVQTDDDGLEHYFYKGSFDRIMDENDQKLELEPLMRGLLEVELIVDHRKGLITGSRLTAIGD